LFWHWCSLEEFGKIIRVMRTMSNQPRLPSIKISLAKLV
jgi:hypothetical protein